MKDWNLVHDSRKEQPGLLDTTASPSTVYQRRNVRQEDGVWVYEQREYERGEWEQMNSPTTRSLMQAISQLELAVARLQGKEAAL